MSDYITIAQITAVFGLKGGVKLSLQTDFLQRFSPKNRLVAVRDGKERELEVRRFMFSAKTPVLFFEGFETPEAAASLINSTLCVPASRAHEHDGDLDKNDFHCSDLIGSQVFVEGVSFGSIHDVIEGGGGHLLAIMKDGREVLIPFVEAIVSTERLSEGRIDVTPPDGLFDEI